MTKDSAPPKSYCNCLALERGLDPVGYAGSFDDAVVMELPLPWNRDMMMQADPLPQQVIDLLVLWLQKYHETGQYNHRPLVVAPDDDYLHEGYRRVMFYTRPKGLFAQFDKVEYLVPVDKLGKLVWSLYEDRTALAQFEAYRMPEADHSRDILVCTHGTVDAACAKFGYPLYKHMRDTYNNNDNLRIWRVSHFGGHVFAPTLMDMPTGHYWAYIEESQAGQIVQHKGDVAALRGHYRGWAGLDDSFQQSAECELWQQHGWDWFDYPKSGETIKQENENQGARWSDVRLHWQSSDNNETSSKKMRVEVSHIVETYPSTADDKTYAYPQYRVNLHQ